MKISTKGRYALRLMLDLAINNTGEYIPIKKIAERQEISEKYLEQIITQISRAGFVRSVRGSQGGYQLANAPEDYTVGMILRLMEGELSPVACLDEPGSCDRADRCVTVDVWKKIKVAIEDVVDHITLADLVKEYNAKGNCEYFI
ncbi:MAG: Rrf2 family transcriptional regulator [Acetobacterium sp.]|nr:Rrf2 family transcriptional regulator [uncultured Acetobacterium sp.]MBI4858259.1 Rrf2 family transcriptional regulator [Acetobacterium woodii]MBU4440033.1 Rrf2 family transcriptional regulator [Bacillota bacterium]MCG2731219.1 Rrf2 family transcriptional regulator [Acetobacterium sp.]